MLKQSNFVDFSNETNQLIVLNDNLAEGKLFDLHTLNGLNDRLNWFENFYTVVDTYYFRDKHAITIQEKLKTIGSHDTIYIWLGNESNEYIWKCAILDFLKELDVNIYVVDWNNITSHTIRGEEYKVDFLRICKPENVEEALQNFRILTHEEKYSFIAIWNKILKNNADLRILKNEILVESNITFYDELLISRCTNEYQKCAYIVGMMLCDMWEQKESGIGDSFLFERLEQLGSLGKLEIAYMIFRGNGYANLFNVRLKNK